jgi:hypothetical protein|tara:strand:+ start:1107 stop:2402 length:1296 start_codon:yes stop_codon:yes gene_type:complete
MHFDKIEDYDFDHGLSFNTQTGEYHSLNPHDLARPLSHTEMDYNLMYQKQTLNGWRIAGSNADLTLNADDLGKVLGFHKVAIDAIEDIGNVMYDRHIAAGLFDGQHIWIPVLPFELATTTLDPCADFTVGGVSWTNSLAYQEPAATYDITVNNSTVAEGNVVTFAINTTGVDNGTTIAWTLGAPVSTEVPTAVTNATTAAPQAYSAGIRLVGHTTNREDEVGITANQPDENATQFTPLDVVGGQVSGVITINNDLGDLVLQIKLDTIVESSELMVFTLASTDSAGNETGSIFSTVNIINIPNCLDDIVSTITECIDDIVSTITECDDDIVSEISEDGAAASGGGEGIIREEDEDYDVSTRSTKAVVELQTNATLDLGTEATTLKTEATIREDLELDTKATTILELRTEATRPEFEVETRATTKPVGTPVSY